MTKEDVTNQAENYIEDTILANIPKAKDIKAQRSPNGDLTLLFKVGRKKETINLKNIDYELSMVSVSDKYKDRLTEYNTKIEEAKAPITEEYKEALEGYWKDMRQCAKEFVIDWINDYFNLEEDLGLTK